MDELNTEAVSTEELSDDVLYAGWGDGSTTDETTVEAEPEEETETETEETDQSEPEEAEDASDDASTEDLEKELEAVSKKADQTFTLKHLDEVKEVNRDEVITLAQKGLDYDRIRTERDSLKAEKATIQEHEDFLKELADLAGLSVEDLMVETKAKLVVADEKKKGYDISLDQAKYRIRSEMKTQKKAEPEPVEEEAPEGPSIQELREANFKRFVEAYPDVKEIPSEVWREFGDGSKVELKDIYARYENKQLKAKIADLEKKKVRSTGSRKSNGSPVKEDDLYVGWG